MSVYDRVLEREGLKKSDLTEEAYNELVVSSVSSIMKFQSMARMLYTLKCAEGADILDSSYIEKSLDPHIWGSMRELLNTIIEANWAEAQRQLYKIWELGYSFEDILFELEHNVIVMGIINHRAWDNIQQFLIRSWIYHSQSRSSITDLMSACSDVKPWCSSAPT
jgi:hypothetical protein